MIYVKLLAAVALVCSGAWFYSSGGWEPGIAIIVSLSALVSAFVKDKRGGSAVGQVQKVTENSVGIQAGGNVSVGTIDRGDE